MNEQKSSITPVLQSATKGWLRRSMVVLWSTREQHCSFVGVCEFKLVFSACLDIRSVAIVCLHLQTANSAKDTHLSSAPSWQCTIWALQSFLCQSHCSLCLFGDVISLLPTFLYTPYHSFFLCFLHRHTACSHCFSLYLPVKQHKRVRWDTAASSPHTNNVDDGKLCGGQKSIGSSFLFPKSCVNSTINRHTWTWGHSQSSVMSVVLWGPQFFKQKEFCYVLCALLQIFACLFSDCCSICWIYDNIFYIPLQKKNHTTARRLFGITECTIHLNRNFVSLCNIDQ